MDKQCQWQSPSARKPELHSNQVERIAAAVQLDLLTEATKPEVAYRAFKKQASAAVQTADMNTSPAQWLAPSPQSR